VLVKSLAKALVRASGNLGRKLANEPLLASIRGYEADAG
jgi:hypothetical protein